MSGHEMHQRPELEKIVVPGETADLGFSRFNLYLIGTGGTGSFAAQHLARLWASGSLAAERIQSLTLVDFDRVEPANVGRQLFTPADVGKPKAEVLARRYSAAYGLKIGAIPKPFTRKRLGETIPAGNFREPTVLLGAVDKAAARLEILTAVKKYAGYRQAVYWFDAGNGESQGQIVWGNTSNETRVRQGLGKPLVEYLPYPPLVFPETTDPAKDQDESAPNCAEAAQAGRQGLNINALMGLLLVEMLRQFLEGRLRVHYVAVDLADFSTAAQTITDEWLETCA
jgi:PRTRC genetic system ThiF family protein